MNHPTSSFPLCSNILSLVQKVSPRFFPSRRLRFGGLALLLTLIFNFAPAAAQGALQGTWRINENGHLGILYLDKHSSGSLFGSISNSISYEPVRGFYSSAEGTFVIVRGSYSAPSRAYVGRYRAPFRKGRISSPATLSGTIYALDAAGGATPQNNQFPFAAVPVTHPYPGLTLLPTPQSSEFCLQTHYTFVNRPAEFGNTWTVPLQFNARPGSGCPTGEFTGLLSGDFIRGSYSPGSGIVVFVRRMASVGFMPSQLFVGQARSDTELVVNRIINGRFYALDTWGGASSQRLTYDWLAQ
jgi:hypothetical protein